jgi:hypothetical protein
VAVLDGVHRLRFLFPSELCPKVRPLVQPRAVQPCRWDRNLGGDLTFEAIFQPARVDVEIPYLFGELLELNGWPAKGVDVPMEDPSVAPEPVRGENRSPEERIADVDPTSAEVVDNGPCARRDKRGGLEEWPSCARVDVLVPTQVPQQVVLGQLASDRFGGSLSRLKPIRLDPRIGAWLADRDSHQDRDRGGPATRRRAVAVDGKTLRGARTPGGDGRPVHLLAAMDHTTRAVLAQRQVGGAPEEVPAFAPLLAPLDLAGVVVTADALQTHPRASAMFRNVRFIGL